MELTMQYADCEAEDLPVGEEEITTGYMGDCVSIIVAWDADNGRYGSMRGFHGFGAFGNIYLDSLFNGVPLTTETRVFLCMGSLSRHSRAERRRMERESWRWAGSTVEWPEGTSTNIRVDRFGSVSFV
ncbi:hypothetical protein ACFXPI_11275 [Streptomyces sp. NPDC059104]|uniref:hypothetical protein n=1 Tax=Streptomyces sp. NPDC059104 TaxID=3346729 RepID=UPI0036C035E3